MKGKAVLVHFPQALVEKLDCLVPRVYPNRCEAIVMAVRDLVKSEVRDA